MPPDAARVRSFVEEAVYWKRSADEAALLRLIRSSSSGVPHDVGAAYATLAARTGNLLDAIDRERLALPLDDRDSVLRFSRRARAVRELAEELDDDALSVSIVEAFELSSCFVLRQAQDDNTLLPARSAVLSPSTRYARSGQAESKGQDDTREGHTDIELAEPMEPEERSGVPAWQKHFSASALNAYAECPRKWFYRYACAAVEDRGSAASAYGTAMHSALEDFHADFPRPRAADDSAMRNRIRTCVTWAFERNRDGFETEVEFELQVRRAQRTAQRYVDWLRAMEREAPFEVLGREVPANLELEGHEFVGFIDRLDRDERTGGIGVVDYKTGSIATSAAEYCDKVRRFQDFQLPFYYWARTLAGDNVTKLVLIPLKDALLDVRPIVLEVARRGSPGGRDRGAQGTIGLDELERSRTRMIELSTLLASNEIPYFETAANPSACTYCAYATACPNKPPPEPARFGS